MMQVGQLKKWLENFPDQCECSAYEGDIVVYWKKAPLNIKSKLCHNGPKGIDFVLGNDGKPEFAINAKGA